MNIFKITIASFMLLTASSVFAVGGVSRACRFDQIPSALKSHAALFFVALGAPIETQALPVESIAEQQKYYILESLTTDYLRVRYWLFVSSAQYSTLAAGTTPTEPRLFRQFNSAWTAEQISQKTLDNPSLAIFFANRKFLYSARAGVPEIIENRAQVVGVETNLRNLDRYRVIGRHFYYDPQTKQTVEIAPSKAANCNLTDFGFADR